MRSGVVFLAMCFPLMDCIFRRGLLFIPLIVHHIEGESLLIGATFKL